MKIELDREEYRTLMEMVGIASWVLTPEDQESSETYRKYEILEQKVLKIALDSGMSNDVTVSGEDDMLVHTDEFFRETRYMEKVAQYDNDVFWNELPRRLAMRDVMKESGGKCLARSPTPGEFTKIEDLTEKYEKELLDHGINRLQVAGACS